MDIGQAWNESQLTRDPLTGRPVRRLTSRGRINQTPTYHTNSGFSADGRYLVFASVRQGATWIIRAEVATGELKALWRAPGIGDRSYIHRGMALDFPDVDGRGICGNRVCVAPRSALAVFTCERAIHAVDLHTCQPRILLEDSGEQWIFGAPCISPDERHVVIALSSAHPDLRAGSRPRRRYLDVPDHKLRLVRVPIDGSGTVETLYEHQPAQSAHCAFCPADGNLLYFDLDLPPRYWGGSDGKTPRIWLLDVSTGRVRPLKNDYPGPFQVHQAWLWDGSGMCYHGGLPGGGNYFGIADPAGRTRWERCYPQASFYGHNTPDARRPAIIIDGEFSQHLLQWLYYDDQDTVPHPKLEPICAHSTQWGSIPGQYSHPHPLTDAAGQWISFTAAKAGRSDVYVVDVAP
ncbi:MAG: hypothetical protein AMJ81_08615 [Phycisphaerae bacterium SM23_33]|jgi:hypothetical protein|nr:MAG: hypothetical protein AMJ81_08615 [Phycisphaerae bacterium SM23_33]